MNARHLFVGAFVVTTGMIVYDEFRNCKELPWPPRFVGTALVFGLLDLFSGLNEELPGVMAIGIVIAQVVQTLQHNKQGFSTNCQHAEATAQPVSYNSLDTPQPMVA